MEAKGHDPGPGPIAPRDLGIPSTGEHGKAPPPGTSGDPRDPPPADGGALSERVLYVYGGDTESRSFSTQPDQDRSARRNLFTSQESRWAINPGNRPSGQIPPGPCRTGFLC